MHSNYLPRLVDKSLEEHLTEFPATMLVGPRACGKTTTAVRRAATVLALDGESFVAGVVFHTGRDTFELDDQIVATPISALWATSDGPPPGT